MVAYRCWTLQSNPFGFGQSLPLCAHPRHQVELGEHSEPSTDWVA
jgi:hypothetical protein